MSDDVVVAGAGPAGSVTALLLARAGLRVRIVERARFPRRKVCGEYLAAGAVDALERLGLADAVAPHAMRLSGVRLCAAGVPVVTLPFARRALSCTREQLDATLLDAARAAGAVLERARVEDVVLDAGRCVGVRVRDESGELGERRAAVVIGADGSGSVVARKLGLATRAHGGRYAVGGHYEGFTTDGHIEMYAGGGAYFALNPIDAQRTNVMVVVPRTQLARWSADVDAGLGGAAAVLGGGRRSFEGAVRVGPRVSSGPLAYRTRSPVAPGALLVGDAAGFVDPFTGQGVLLALTGAERAAHAVLARDHEAYAAWRSSDAAWRARLCRTIAAMIALPPLARRAARGLERYPRAAGELLDALGGLRPPRSAFTPSVLGRLLA